MGLGVGVVRRLGLVQVALATHGLHPLEEGEVDDSEDRGRSGQGCRDVMAPPRQPARTRGLVFCWCSGGQGRTIGTSQLDGLIQPAKPTKPQPELDGSFLPQPILEEKGYDLKETAEEKGKDKRKRKWTEDQKKHLS
ncbi:hypothetical protein E2C01_001845 [Portunus trituberculatus]|uniref:Uncharacterized protein n=1 Tax=Portunus trituberculatus TaxID=210409 RepID=A0A5B7CHR3_PORTR|nr:hypothetical protein [Portunus trituberculatus]